MSQITKPVLTEEAYIAKMDEQNALLSIIAGHQLTNPVSYKEIADIVKKGLAPKIFSIGDQINVTWNDGSSAQEGAGNSYDVPLDIVAFQDVELRDGSIVPGMFLQWHYTTSIGMPFDAAEAIYVAESPLPPGEYYFTQVEAWGSKALVTAGQVWSFTTTVEIPAGGHICINTGAVDDEEADIRIYTYADGATTTALETLTPGHATTGTSLGTWSSSNKYGDPGLNNMQRSVYGYNRWSQSALRQWLNSDKAAGTWWSSQNPFDRVPTEAATNRGFLAGFATDFLSIIKPIKVRTYLNTVSDSAITPNYEDTYDLFFPASLEQEFVNPQIAGEGSYWEYWKQRVGHPNPTAQYATEAERIRYAINAKTSTQICRLRSAGRGNASGSWGVFASGGVGGGSAATAFRCAPACVIC